MENTQDFELKDIDGVYRKFSIEDFNEPEFDVIESEVTPNEDGYVSDEIYQLAREKINQENSTVINAAVGQGKTTAVFKIIKEHFENTTDIIVIAVPFRALVQKYKEKISSDINADYITTIFDLEGDVGNSITASELELFIKRRIHIITINLLLRNAGDFFHQNEIKKKYLDNFISRLVERNRKIAFFFDEIHAAVHNFSSENIFSFFKFSDVTKKIYYISATYNEASLMIVRFLSKATSNKVYIINSKRVRKPNADLHIIISAKRYSSNNTEELKFQLENVITRTIKKDQPLNILTYSRELAKSIVGKGKNKFEDSIYSIFKDLNVESNLNLLVASSKIDTSSNELNENKINIGTTFNTGIDISNGTFIVIMPDSSMLNDIKMKYGIFTGGSNSIFQSIGRMRGDGEVYVVTGKSKDLIYPAYSDYNLKLGISKYFTFRNHHTSFPYINYSDESRVLKMYYKSRYDFNKIEIENNQILEADNGMGLALRYPTYAEWVLKNGEKFLSSEYLYYGKSLTPIVVWAAIHNQFHNCNLKSLTLYNTRIDFNSRDLFIECHGFIENYYTEDLGDMKMEDGTILSGLVDNLVHRMYSLSDYELYLLLIDRFNECDIFIDNKQLIYGVDVRLKTIIIEIIYYKKKGLEDYGRGDYLNDLISFSKSFDFNSEELIGTKFRNENLVVLASELDIMIQEWYTFLSQREYIYKEFKSDNLKESYRELLLQINSKCQEIKNVDELISINGFDLFRISEIGFIYKQLCMMLLKTEEFIPAKKGRDFDRINGTRRKVIKLLGRRDYSILKFGVNSFYTYSYESGRNYYDFDNVLVL